MRVLPEPAGQAGPAIRSPGPAPSRPTWVPVPVLVRLRPCLAYTAASGLLAAVVCLLLGRTGAEAPPLVVLAVSVLAALTFVLAVLGLLGLTSALEAGPGDDMSAYGEGQDIEVVWHGERREQGRFALEDAAEADVGITRPRRRGEAPAVVLRLDGRTHRVRCGPEARAPLWYALLDESDREIARAEASTGGSGHGLVSPHAPVDWTIRPSRGPDLRVRHGHCATPRRVTLLDSTGTAWLVRNRTHAVLPQELDLLDALFVVVLVDLLGRAAGARESARLNAVT